jgi:hypothetical protein
MSLINSYIRATEGNHNFMTVPYLRGVDVLTTYPRELRSL